MKFDLSLSLAPLSSEYTIVVVGAKKGNVLRKKRKLLRDIFKVFLSDRPGKKGHPDGYEYTQVLLHFYKFCGFSYQKEFHELFKVQNVLRRKRSDDDPH